MQGNAEKFQSSAWGNCWRRPSSPSTKRRPSAYYLYEKPGADLGENRGGKIGVRLVNSLFPVKESVIGKREFTSLTPILPPRLSPQICPRLPGVLYGRNGSE